jgi:hypothetical protein
LARPAQRSGGCRPGEKTAGAQAQSKRGRRKLDPRLGASRIANPREAPQGYPPTEPRSVSGEVPERRTPVDVLNYLQQAIKTCTNIVKWGADMQGNARASLVTELQSICSNCEDAYGAILARLVPVKNASTDATALARELRDFAADQTVRNQFKPDHLCGNIDQLMQNLRSNLHPLKYSIEIKAIDELQKRFQSYRNYDLEIYRSYDDFTRELDRVADQLGDPSFDPAERARYARHAIDNFQTELSSALDTVRQAKADLLAIV